jgi:glucokinase
VIGVGTGLGVAAVVPNGRGWLAIPGEGGHATAAAGDDFEAAVLAVARRSFDHVSAERVLSGIGLPLLHGAVCEVLGQPAPSALETPAIVERGLAGDTACERTLATFCALLGSFAGSVALTFGARGGTYIGGGIVPRLGDYFFRSAFRERFEAKGRLRSYMQAIPTAVIVDSLAALTGAAAALDA